MHDRRLSFRQIKSILDKEDVEGLRAMGSPPDEYDSEASLIEREIAKLSNLEAKPLTTAQVATIVAEVWISEFGPFADEELEKRRPAFESVAKRILEQP
jgi:hypothetical protein